MYVTLSTIYIDIYFLGTRIERDIIAVYERVLSGKLREDYRKTSPTIADIIITISSKGKDRTKDRRIDTLKGQKSITDYLLEISI